MVMKECAVVNSAVVLNTKRRCRLLMDDDGNLIVEEFFEKGECDRGRIVRERGWVTLWENTISTAKIMKVE
jgi:hypothetical protein